MKQFTCILIVTVFALHLSMTSNSQDLDNTFGASGKSIVDINNTVQLVNTVKVQTNGKILVCGNNSAVGIADYFVIRQNTNGTLDNTFDSDGKLTFTVPGTVTTGGYSTTMSLQSDGKILIGGSYYDGTNRGSVVVRLNTDGSFDNTFGTNGFQKFSILGSSDIVQSILILSSSKLYVVGSAYNGTVNEIYIAKLNADGSFDTSFDTDGKITFTGSIDNNNQAILQTDNKIVIGNANNVKRINTDGTFDNTFGTSGVSTIAGININSLCLLKSNKIVVAGDSLGYFAIAKLNTDGTKDNTFGTNGKNIFTPIGLEASNSFTCVAEDTSNTRLIAGGVSFYTHGNVGYMAIVDFLANGTVNHYTTINAGTNISKVSSLKIQSDRKIVLAGTEGNGSNDDIAVVRLNADFGTFVTTNTMSSEQLTTGINLFPNPASQNINVHSVYNIEQIKVIDVLGNEVLNVTSSGNTQVDISSLPKGLYNFVITTDKGMGSKKVSVQ